MLDMSERPLDPPVPSLRLTRPLSNADSAISILGLDNATVANPDPENIIPEATPAELKRALSEKPIPPADVGIWPWLQVLAGFFMMFNSWGIIVSYGSYQTYYTQGGITDVTSESTIAWIGSIQVFAFVFVGALSGKFFDAGHYKLLIWIGSFLAVFGTMMISLATQYWQLILAQGICVGAGIGLLFVAPLGLAATWFVKHRGLAVGIVTTGSAVAGIIYPIMLEKLIQEVGFPWAVRIQGFIIFATLGSSLLVASQRLPPRKRGGLVEYQALAEPAFALYSAGMTLAFLGIFMVYAFIENWAIQAKIDLHGLPVFYIIPILNAAGLFGRVIPSYLSDIVGPFNVQVPSMFFSGLIILLWIPVHNLTGLICIAIFYGFFSGPVLSLSMPAVVSITSDLTHAGSRFGMLAIFLAFASLIGNPVTGATIVAENGGYGDARIWSGVVMIAGSVLCAAARLYTTGLVLRAKA